MNWWNLTLIFTFPHDRFLVGWELLTPDEHNSYYTFSLCLGILTIAFDWE